MRTRPHQSSGCLLAGQYECRGGIELDRFLSVRSQTFKPRAKKRVRVEKQKRKADYRKLLKRMGESGELGNVSSGASEPENENASEQGGSDKDVEIERPSADREAATIHSKKKRASHAPEGNEASSSASSKKMPQPASGESSGSGGESDGQGAGRSKRKGKGHPPRQHKPNPFEKEASKWEAIRQAKEEEMRRQQEDRAARQQELQRKERERRRQTGKLMQRTSSGQPVMKHMINNLLAKIQKGS
eukprot:tig00000381_g24530.t1